MNVVKTMPHRKHESETSLSMMGVGTICSHNKIRWRHENEVCDLQDVEWNHRGMHTSFGFCDRMCCSSKLTICRLFASDAAING
jgi:hypothetical protein